MVTDERILRYRSLHSQLLEAVPKRSKADSQTLSGRRFIPSGGFQSLLDGLSLYVLQVVFQVNLAIGHRGSLVIVGLAFRDNLGGGRRRLYTISQVQIAGINLIGIAKRKGALQNIFEFPYVAREIVLFEPPDGALG